MIRAIRDEIENRIKVSFWQKVKNSVGGSTDQLFRGLEALLDEADAGRFISVMSTRTVDERTQTAEEETRKQTFRGDALSLPETAMHVVRERVDAWPDQRGRAILRSALGFDHGTQRGRPSDLICWPVNSTRHRLQRVMSTVSCSTQCLRLA
jgi:hypothetical protein